MKKNRILILAFGFIFCLSVSAQNPMPGNGEPKGQKPEMRQGGERQQMTPQMRAERMAKQLGLTDDEKTKVQALYEKLNADREKFRKDNASLDREQMRAKFDEMRKNEDAEMAKILSPESLKKYQDFRKEQMEKMKQRMESGGDGQRQPRPLN